MLEQYLQGQSYNHLFEKLPIVSKLLFNGILTVICADFLVFPFYFKIVYTGLAFLTGF